MSIANINSYIVRSATQLNLGIEPTEATNEAIRLGSIDQVSSAGVFPSLVFHVTIQNTLCELSIRAIQINAFNYLIKSSLRGIEAKGKAEVKSLQLNMKEFQNKQKSLLGRYEIRKESVLLRIKNALLLPLFHRDSLHLMNLPSQILLQVLTYSQVFHLIIMSLVS